MSLGAVISTLLSEIIFFNNSSNYQLIKHNISLRDFAVKFKKFKSSKELFFYNFNKYIFHIFTDLDRLDIINIINCKLYKIFCNPVILLVHCHNAK